MAGEELLHGGLFEVALLGDEPVQPAQQPIHIAQRLRDGALFGKWWEQEAGMLRSFARLMFGCVVPRGDLLE